MSDLLPHNLRAFAPTCKPDFSETEKETEKGSELFCRNGPKGCEQPLRLFALHKRSLTPFPRFPVRDYAARKGFWMITGEPSSCGVWEYPPPRSPFWTLTVS